MREQKAFDNGMMAGFFFSFAAFAGNWLITPMSHPDASSLRTAAVLGQALLCLGIGLYLVLRRRPKSSPSTAV
jgi:hypothetical protein